MSDEAEHDKYLEDRARSLGLPTDPEAYQDGGLAVAATLYNAVEADVLAAFLNQVGVPAWVDSPNVARLYGWAPGYFADGVRVFVPLGRLDDANALLAEHAKEGTSEEGEEAVQSRSSWGTGASLFLLIVGLWMVLATVLLTCSAAARGPEPVEVVLLVFMGFLGLAALTAGILGLRGRPKPED